MFGSVVAIGCALAGGRGILPPWAAALTLEARVAEAMEGGPVVVEVALTNRGAAEVEVDWKPGPQARLTLPPAWAAVPRGPVVEAGGKSGVAGIGAEESRVEWFVLHADYASRFPPGRGTLAVERRVTVHPPHGVAGSPVTFALRVRLEVDVPSATPANLAALAGRLDAELAAIPKTAGTGWGRADPYHRLTQKFTGVRHKELLPVAVKLLDRKVGPGGRPRELEEMVIDADPPAAHRLFVDRLAAPNLPADADGPFATWKGAEDAVCAPLVRAWRGGWASEWAATSRRPDPVPAFARGFAAWVGDVRTHGPRVLPDGELKRLASADDFWVRARAFTTFADRLGPAWADAFLADAKARHASKLDPARTARLLTDLDAASYPVRERATASLLSDSWAVGPAVAEAATASASPEVRWRAAYILSRLPPAPPPDPRASRVLAGLSPAAGPDRRLLDVLAGGAVIDPVAVAARRRLADFAREAAGP